MKRIIRKSILWTILLTTIVACEEEVVERDKESYRTEDVGLKVNFERQITDLDSTIVVEVSVIDSVDFEGLNIPIYELEIEGPEAEVEAIVPGSVVYLPKGEKGGKLIFVNEIEEVQRKSAFENKGGKAVLVKGAHATLDMYFNGEHTITQFSTPENRSKRSSTLENKLVSPDLFPWGDLEPRWEEDEEIKEGLEFSSTQEYLCQISLNKTLWESGDSYISVDGTLGIQPALDLFLEYEPVEVTKGSKVWNSVVSFCEAAVVPENVMVKYQDNNYYMGNMKELWSNLYVDVDRELNFHLRLAKEYEKTTRIKLGSYIIPAVPVSLDMELAFEIDFKVLGEMELDILNSKEEDIVVSLLLDREMEEPVWDYTYEQRSETELSFEAKLEISTGISLVLSTEVYLFGIVGPEFNVGPFLEAKASVTATSGFDGTGSVDWLLTGEAGVKASATLNLSAFHVDKATWKMFTLLDKSWSEIIYQAPSYLSVISGNNQQGVQGSELSEPIKVGAYDSRDNLIQFLPVPVYFETSEGIVNPSKDLTNAGIAETTWTLGGQNVNQILFAYYKRGGTRQGDVEVSATAVDNPELKADFFVDRASIQVGENVNFTDLSSGNPSSWVWDFGDGGSSIIQNPSYIYSTSGNYTVSLTVQGESSSDTETKTSYIQVKDEGDYPDSVTDPDGRVYASVEIGDQIWMAENLAYLPSVDYVSAESYSSARYYVYGYNGSSLSEAKALSTFDTYGALYNWTAAQEVCPSGWHLPSDEEWKELEMTLGLTEVEVNAFDYRGTQIADKLRSTTGWGTSYNGSNESGFGALPGGVRHDVGEFTHKGVTGRFWTSTSHSVTQAYGRTLRYNLEGISRYNEALKETGLSVRCVKD